MFKRIITAVAASIVCAGSSLMAQMPTTTAVEELTSKDESLVSFRKLLSEYMVTEIASCNLMKVVGYDTVGAAKNKLKIASAKDADPKSLQELLKALKADALCAGTVVRENGVVKAEISVFKDGAWQPKKATITMKSIEDTDSAARTVTMSLEEIIKGSVCLEPRIPGDKDPISENFKVDSAGVVSPYVTVDGAGVISAAATADSSKKQ